MKRFLIEYKEISYGAIEVFAESEAEAREIAETEGMRYEDDSEMELGEVTYEEEIDDYDN
jgi:hypothetical protein